MKKQFMADKETVEKRLDICRSCPHRKRIICGKCGCILQGKTRILKEKCPVGKW